MKSQNQLLFLLVCIQRMVHISLGLECGFPGVPLNGSVSGSGMIYYTGETVTYTCQTGFVLSGPNTRTCSENGTWSNSVPECRENMALNKPALQSTTLWHYDPKLAVDADPNTCSFTTRTNEQRWWQVQLSKNIIVQSVVISITPESFQKFTIFVIELLEGNKAMYKPCSKFSGNFDAAKKAAFLCNDGLGHPGQFVYIRDEREVQEFFGLCEVEVFQLQNETMCGDPEQPVSSLIKMISPTEVEYTCSKGYRLEGGNHTRICSRSGVWSGQTPRCVEVQCTDPMSVKDGFIEVSNFKGRYVYGSVATYHCNPGFILWGNASRLCADDGRWTGVRPQCNPISCGLPPEVLNSKSQLMNGSTSWKAMVSYTCKPGYKMVHQNQNLSEIWSLCTESGIWQTLAFNCVFDPLAVNLKQGTKIFGELSILGEDGLINYGTLATIGVLSTLVFLVFIVVILFFNQKRKTDGSERKISRSSTNQLIADVANGLAAHFEGPNPPLLDEKLQDRAIISNEPTSNAYATLESCALNDSTLIEMTSPKKFVEGPGSIIEIKDWNLLAHSHQQQCNSNGDVHCHNERSKSSQTVDFGKRSSGDGDSSIEDSNFSFKQHDKEFIMARRPDGRTDDNIYSTLRETKLISNPEFFCPEPHHHQTTIHDEHLYERLAAQNQDLNTGIGKSQVSLVKNAAAVNQELMSLYAQVDKTKLFKPRGGGGSSCSTASLCSPTEDPINKNQESPLTVSRKTRGQNNFYANINSSQDIKLTENPSSYGYDLDSSGRQKPYRPTTLHYNTYRPQGSRTIGSNHQRDPSELSYATISGSSKRLVPHLRSANV